MQYYFLLVTTKQSPCCFVPATQVPMLKSSHDFLSNHSSRLCRALQSHIQAKQCWELMQNLHHLHFIVFSQDQPKLARSPLLLIFHAPPVTEE